MLLLHAMPNVDDTPANRGFRKYFYSRWGKENCVISARERRVEYPDFTQRLSIKAAWGGSELYHIDGRTVAVDDDSYLLINDLRTYRSSLRSLAPVHSFSVFFRPGLAEETLGAMLTRADRLLEEGGETPRPIEFVEMLRPHDRRVSPILRYIAREADRGFTDDLWYEEQFSFLLERMLRVHRVDVAAIDGLQRSRQGLRRELFRRIGWGTDYINTFYMRPLTITELAASACMSRFHFIRLFAAVHHMTPFVYLQRKRAEVARRLLLSTKQGIGRIAERVGFESRSTMLRQVRRLTGVNPRALRRDRKPASGDDRLR